jgi:hypothetical protein
MALVAKSPVTDAVTVEREIIARLRAAKVRLRFDKVALRLVGRLKAALASAVPEGQTVIFTISAPIRLPGKTVEALETMMRSDRPDAERGEIVHDKRGSNPPAEGSPKAHAQGAGFRA